MTADDLSLPPYYLDLADASGVLLNRDRSTIARRKEMATLQQTAGSFIISTSNSREIRYLSKTAAG